MEHIKHIEDITIDDLKAHRWYYYESEEDDYDELEYIISDKHPHFSEDFIELELAEFTFSNGKKAFGIYDGSESFNIMTPSDWYSMWYGPDKPEAEDLKRLSTFLSDMGFTLPVVARAKWSGTTKTYNGIQYLNESGNVSQAVI